MSCFGGGGGEKATDTSSCLELSDSGGVLNKLSPNSWNKAISGGRSINGEWRPWGSNSRFGGADGRDGRDGACGPDASTAACGARVGI